MNEIQPLPDEETFEELLITLSEQVIEECGVTLDPDEHEWAEEYIEEYDHFEAGDVAILIDDTDKSKIINSFRNAEEFDTAIQGFFNYCEDSTRKLTPSDWNSIQKQANTDGGVAAYRTHAERIAYYRIIKYLDKNQKVIYN